MHHHDWFERYEKQIILPEIGYQGQKKIAEAKVLLIGVGGLGCTIAQHLVSSGIGVLGLVDHDTIALNNLHRQILYREDDVGLLKVNVATSRLKNIYVDSIIHAYPVRVSQENVDMFCSEYDVIVDASDNFETRYLLNDACVRLQKMFVYGSVLRFTGYVSVVSSSNSACYRCIFPNMPEQQGLPSCVDGGILGTMPVVIASLQAQEVMKCILNMGSLLTNRLLMYHALNATFQEFTVSKNEACLVCSTVQKEKNVDRDSKIA